VLTNLKAVFITHAHLDHTMGLISIIQKRKEVFGRSRKCYRVVVSCYLIILTPLPGLPYKPLVLALDIHVRAFRLDSYCNAFDQLGDLVVLVDVSMFATNR